MEFLLDEGGQQVAELHGPCGLGSVAAGPGCLELVGGGAADAILAPVLVDGGEVGVVVVGSVDEAELILHRAGVGELALVAAFLGGGAGPESETLAAISPAGLVVGDGALGHAVPVDLAPVVEVGVAVARPVGAPHMGAGDVLPLGDRVRDGGQDLFERVGDGDEEALEAVVALAAGEGNVASATVVCGQAVFDLVDGEGLGGVGEIPAGIAHEEERAAVSIRHGDGGAGATDGRGIEGQRDEARVLKALRASVTDLGDSASRGCDIDGQRLAPDSVGEGDRDGAVIDCHSPAGDDLVGALGSELAGELRVLETLGADVLDRVGELRPVVCGEVETAVDAGAEGVVIDGHGEVAERAGRRLEVVRHTLVGAGVDKFEAFADRVHVRVAEDSGENGLLPRREGQLAGAGVGAGALAGEHGDAALRAGLEGEWRELLGEDGEVVEVDGAQVVVSAAGDQESRETRARLQAVDLLRRRSLMADGPLLPPHVLQAHGELVAVGVQE